MNDEEKEIYNDECYYSELYNEYSEEAETALIAQHMDFKDINELTWLGDTGPSAHMTNRLKAM